MTFRRAVKTRTTCRGMMGGKEMEKMDLDNTSQKCVCEVKDREMWDWTWVLECMCLLDVLG